MLFPEPEESDLELAETVTVKMTISGTDFWGKKKLLETIDLPELSPPDAELLKEFLTHHHDVFSLVDGECGETDLVYMKINTGEASPKKQPPFRCSPGSGQTAEEYAAEWSYPALSLPIAQSCCYG